MAYLSLFLPTHINCITSLLQQTYQIATNYTKSQQVTIFLISYKSLQYALIYAIIQKARTAKEIARDYDGRRNLLHAGRNRKTAENGRRLSNTTFTPEENTCLQNQWTVAYRPQRIQGIHGKEQEHSRRERIKKAGRCQHSNKTLAAQLLPLDWTPFDNSLSTCRLLRILTHVVRCCQPLYNLCLICKWVVGGVYV